MGGVSWIAAVREREGGVLCDPVGARLEGEAVAIGRVERGGGVCYGGLVGKGRCSLTWDGGKVFSFKGSVFSGEFPWRVAGQVFCEFRLLETAGRMAQSRLVKIRALMGR